MSRKMNIYYNAIVGSLAGLFAWLVLGFLPYLEEIPIVPRAIAKGALVGILIGGALGIVEGVLDKSRRKILLGLAAGVGAGTVGGALGLVLAEGTLQAVGGGLVGRPLGWAILGLLVGASEGLANRSQRKSSYGAVGGVTGGFVGGFALEYLSGYSSQIEAWTVGLGLIILGACIGSLIAVVEEVLAEAKVKVLTGPLEGREFNLTKQLVTLGRDERCDISLPGDPSIAMRHGEIRRENKQFILRPVGGARLVVNKQAIAGTQLLSNNDLIWLSKTLVQFNVLARKEGRRNERSQNIDS